MEEMVTEERIVRRAVAGVATVVASALTMILAGVVTGLLVVGTLVAAAQPASAVERRYDERTTGWKTTSYLGPWGGNWNVERKISSWRTMQTVWTPAQVTLFTEVCARLHYSAGPVNMYRDLGCSTTSQRI